MSEDLTEAQKILLDQLNRVNENVYRGWGNPESEIARRKAAEMTKKPDPIQNNVTSMCPWAYSFHGIARTCIYEKDHAEPERHESEDGFTWRSRSALAYRLNENEMQAATQTIDEAALLTSKSDAVVHPAHYNQVPGVECIDVVQRFSFNRGNIIKHVWRCGEKGNPIQDLLKARQYLDFELKLLGWTEDGS